MLQCEEYVQLDRQQQHLNEVLNSRSLAAAPKLRLLLSRLAQSAFLGEEPPKEYTLGVELFDRPAAFDPKEDSIVRVNINRLRHKLREYYAEEAPDSLIRIEFEKGSYLPRFAGRDRVDPAASVVPATPPPDIASAPALALTRRAWQKSALAAAAIPAAFGLGAVASRRFGSGAGAPLEFQRLSHHRARISGARYSLEGRQVVYSSSLDGGPSRLWSRTFTSPETHSLNLPAGRLAGLCSSGAALIVQSPGPSADSSGTLARVSIAGGALKPLREEVSDADCDRSGEIVALVSRSAPLETLEFPIGRPLGPCPSGRVRVSPDGSRVASLDFSGYRKQGIHVTGRDGRKRLLCDRIRQPTLPVWTPDGSALLFGGASGLDGYGIFRCGLEGGLRKVASVPDLVQLWDIGPSGQLLAALERVTFSVAWLRADEPRRNVSWLGSGIAEAISSDGSKLLLVEIAQAGGKGSAAYAVDARQSTPVLLGPAHSGSLSPDGTLAALIGFDDGPARLTIVPVGSGEPRDLSTPGLAFRYVGFTPDSKFVSFAAADSSGTAASYLQSIDGVGPPRRISPPGFTGRFISPDGQWLIAGKAGSYYMVSMAGPGVGEPKLLRPPTRDRFLAWHADSRRLFCSRFENGRTLTVYLFDIFTGSRQDWRRIESPDPATVELLDHNCITSDGLSLAISQKACDSALVQMTGGFV